MYDHIGEAYVDQSEQAAAAQQAETDSQLLQEYGLPEGTEVIHDTEYYNTLVTNPESLQQPTYATEEQQQQYDVPEGTEVIYNDQIYDQLMNNPDAVLVQDPSSGQLYIDTQEGINQQITDNLQPIIDYQTQYNEPYPIVTGKQ